MLEPWYILGGGALGKLWSARLGHSATLLLKEKTWSPLELPRTATIDVHEKFNWNHLRRARVHVECASAKGPINRLLVTTKAKDVSSAVQDVFPRLTSDSIIVVLCNGMGVHEELLAMEDLKGFSYLLASTTHGAYSTGKLSCVHAGFGQTWVGAPHGSPVPQAEIVLVAKSLNRSGLHVLPEAQIEQVLWEKLAVNACINAVTALLNCQNGIPARNRHGQHVFKTVCKEIEDLMEATGLDVPPAAGLLKRVFLVSSQTADNFSSMQQDMIACRNTEIDYINGFVVKQGARLQIPTPANDVIYNIIKIKEAIQRRS